jgi:hypothetical protein
MVRVLLVGYDPEAVDYSDPALPPGMNAEKMRAGIMAAIKQVTDRGWQGDLCLIRPDEMAVQTVQRQLASANYNCVVIGAGVRCLLKALCSSRRLSTPSIEALRLRPSPSTRGRRTARMLQPDGCLPAERCPRGIASLGRSHDPSIAGASAAPPRASG